MRSRCSLSAVSMALLASACSVTARSSFDWARPNRIDAGAGSLELRQAFSAASRASHAASMTGWSSCIPWLRNLFAIPRQGDVKFYGFKRILLGSLAQFLRQSTHGRKKLTSEIALLEPAYS